MRELVNGVKYFLYGWRFVDDIGIGVEYGIWRCVLLFLVMGNGMFY